MSPTSSHSPSPYRWAIGAQQVPQGQTIGDRYIVVAPRIWRDTQPDQPPPPLPDMGMGLHKRVQPYRQLQSLPYAAVQHHLPQLQAVIGGPQPVLLLSGGLNASGRLHPPLHRVWQQAPTLQQVQWLWQLCSLWEALSDQGVATSLLQSENLRVDGDRLCLLTLIPDGAGPPSLADLGRLWLPWTIYAGSLSAPLQQIGQRLLQAAEPDELFEAEYQLNRLLLETAVQSGDWGTTHWGTTHIAGSASAAAQSRREILPLAAICSGPSSAQVSPYQVVQSLALQTTAMAHELERCSLLSPRWIGPQILAMVRIIHNMLLTEGSSEPLALAFALGISQPLASDDGQATAHEVYLFTTGNCCAYQRQGQQWYPLPSATGAGLGEKPIHGQLLRLVITGDQTLLLSTQPLEERQPAGEHQEDARVDLATDLAEVSQWARGQTGESGAIALMACRTGHLAQECSPEAISSSVAAPPSPAAPPSDPANTAPAGSTPPMASAEAVELSEAEVNPLPDVPSPDFLEDVAESRQSELPSSIGDSIGAYLNTDIQPPRAPDAKVILDQDIEHGLSNLVDLEASEAPEGQPEAPPAKQFKPSAPQTVAPRRQRPKARRPERRRRRPARPKTAKRPKPARQKRQRPRRQADSGLILLLLILLLAAAAVGGAIIWQQRSEQPEPQSSQTQPAIGRAKTDGRILSLKQFLSSKF